MENGILITNLFKMTRGKKYLPGNAVQVFIDGEMVESIHVAKPDRFSDQSIPSLKLEAIALDLQHKYPDLEIQNNPKRTGAQWDSIREHQKRHNDFVEKNGHVFRTDLPRKK